MDSMYARALGEAFDRLHPRVRARLDLSSERPEVFVGRGVMVSVERHPLAVPVLALLSLRHMLVPGRGRDVPFVIRNRAFVDGLGRENVAWLREFRFNRRARRFDAWMVWNEAERRIVDYFGTHQDLSADLRFTCTEAGGFVLQSEAQRLHLGRWSVRLPRILAGTANAEEWFNEARERFEIRVRITNPLIGRVVAYEGHYAGALIADPHQGGPDDFRPARERAAW